MARKVRELEDAPPNIAGVQSLQVPEDADEEVRELTEALLRYSRRLAHFLERERQFTRDASHELRSPLTVIRMAASILLEDPDLNDSRRRTAQRIQRACFDMEELTNAFLLLARESESGLPMEAICVNDLIAEEVERAKLLATDKPVAAEVRSTHRVFLDAPEKVLSILLGNLLRNAFSYTDAGGVVVEIGEGKVSIRDTGVGMAAEKIEEMFRPFVRGEGNRRVGHGVGLSIVRRLSDRFGWPIEIVSQPGVGTAVHISFPARVRNWIRCLPRTAGLRTSPLLHVFFTGASRRLSDDVPQEKTMTFAARQAINWTEQGLVPDAIIRGAIRRLLRARLSELRPDDAAHAAEVTARFAADMNGAHPSHPCPRRPTSNTTACRPSSSATRSVHIANTAAATLDPVSRHWPRPKNKPWPSRANVPSSPMARTSSSSAVAGDR